MKLMLKWLFKLLICAILFCAGYMTHKVTDRNEYDWHSPTVPKLPNNAPKMFLEYEKNSYFDDILGASFRRGEGLYDFYDAWKNKETYGVYDNGWGLDDLVHMYWLTKDGKIYRFCISDHGSFSGKKAYYVDESDSVSIYCAGEHFDGHENHDPNTIINCYLNLKADFKKENRQYID